MASSFRFVLYAVLVAGLAAGLVGGCDADETPVLVTRYSDSGRAVWSYPLEGERLNAVRPHVDDGRAYVAADSLLRCVDLETGAVLWTRQLAATRSLGARHLVADSARVYLNHFDTVWAFDKSDGRVAWRNAVADFEGPDLQGLGHNATHLLLGGVGEVVRIRRVDGGIDRRVAIPGADTLDTETFALQPSLAPDGSMIVPSFYRRAGSRFFEGGIHVFNPDGTIRWSRRTQARDVTTPSGAQYTAGGGVHGTSLSGDAVAYTTGQSVVMRDLETGDVRWRRFMPEDGFGIGPTVHDSLVFAGSTTGRLFALDAATGATRWTAQVEGGLLAQTVVRDGVAYQIDDGFGALWAFDAATGAKRWSDYPPEFSRDESATYRTPPAVGSHRLVVVGANRVYGLAVGEAE